MSSDQTSGYIVAYEQEELQFPVYVLAAIACVLIATGVWKELPILLALSLFPLAGFFYNLPLLETGRWRLGAGQYGLVIEGLGLIQWRAIDAIELLGKEDRGGVNQIMHVELKVPIEQALILDWRNRSLMRRLMRLPWSWASPLTICVPLDIMDKPADEIHKTFLRMWRFYRGQEPPPLRS